MSVQSYNLDIPWHDSTLGAFVRSLQGQYPDTDFAITQQLFSPTCLFISKRDLDLMVEAVRLTNKVFPLKKDTTQGLCMGYDFHITDMGPKLIEINTNAGGAFLNLARNKAMQLPNIASVQNLKLRWCYNPSFSESKLIQQFASEWDFFTQGDQYRKLNHLLLVDDNPSSQFLYLEFLLFKDLLSKHIPRISIADPSTLNWHDVQKTLFFENTPVDFIYNRLTDFYFKQQQHQHLKSALECNAVLFSPCAYHHSLLADKSHFTKLSSPDFLKNTALTENEMNTLLQIIPKTEKVDLENKDQLWSNRKNLFFKPTSGYGSKAVYRGDKVTHKVFDELFTTRSSSDYDYIAQDIVVPSCRKLEFDGAMKSLKYDVRLYSYAGEAFLVAARLYDGQATNFRTPCGGFAPVFLIED